jgi:hypothetical protein
VQGQLIKRKKFGEAHLFHGEHESNEESPTEIILYSSFTFSHNKNPLIGNLTHNNSNGVSNEQKE